MADRIERSLELDVPTARVWRALTEHLQISAWFGARFEEPFHAGKTAAATVTHPGYEGLTFEINVVARNEPQLFSFEWHPYPIDLNRDYSAERRTLVEFHLRPMSKGTRLTVIETGFDGLPADRAAQAYAGNSEGWDNQLRKIAKHLDA
jgi:uncharacterized protein YndB with AHSA1/START domain